MPTAPSSANLKKIANLGAATYSPIPDLLIAKLPAKLRKIDPEGCAQYEAEQDRLHKDWVKQMNVLQSNISNSIKT